MEQDITIYLAKAEESLRTAESEFANGRYNSCANRCYYACFQAAIAALLREEGDSVVGGAPVAASRRRLRRFCARASARVGSGTTRLSRHSLSAY